MVRVTRSAVLNKLAFLYNLKPGQRGPAFFCARKNGGVVWASMSYRIRPPSLGRIARVSYGENRSRKRDGEMPAYRLKQLEK